MEGSESLFLDSESSFCRSCQQKPKRSVVPRHAQKQSASNSKMNVGLSNNTMSMPRDFDESAHRSVGGISIDILAGNGSNHSKSRRSRSGSLSSISFDASYTSMFGGSNASLCHSRWDFSGSDLGFDLQPSVPSVIGTRTAQPQKPIVPRVSVPLIKTALTRASSITSIGDNGEDSPPMLEKAGNESSKQATVISPRPSRFRFKQELRFLKRDGSEKSGLGLGPSNHTFITSFNQGTSTASGLRSITKQELSRRRLLLKRTDSEKSGLSLEPSNHTFAASIGRGLGPSNHTFAPSLRRATSDHTFPASIGRGLGPSNHTFAHTSVTSGSRFKRELSRRRFSEQSGLSLGPSNHTFAASIGRGLGPSNHTFAASFGRGTSNHTSATSGGSSHCSILSPWETLGEENIVSDDESVTSLSSASVETFSSKMNNNHSGPRSDLSRCDSIGDISVLSDLDVSSSSHPQIS